jgi:hypothetical protein
VKKSYETPKITTLSSKEILKLLGPAQAGAYGNTGGVDL